jgi:exodeoxyribonuclease III
MKIVSWNVNGIRAVLKKGFLDFVRKENPDVLILQEIKAHPEQVDEILKDYKEHFWNPAEKKGYSGTAVFSRKMVLRESYGLQMANKEKDEEGRIIVLEFEKFFLVNVYTPNSQRELVRLEYRKKWDKDFLELILRLKKKKEVLVGGDFNVAHKEIDLKNPKANEKNAGFTKEEREGFDDYLNKGFIDSFREFNKKGENYSWWSYMFNARERNIGWRIDYFLNSVGMRGKIKKSEILKDVGGSDHAPILVELDGGNK